MQQLLVIKIPGAQKKTAYNMAQKAGMKISIHTIGKNASILIVIEKSLLNCNLLNLPESLHGVYRFFDEMRKRNFEYTVDVYTHSYEESKKRNFMGLFDMKQTTLC